MLQPFDKENRPVGIQFDKLIKKKRNLILLWESLVSVSCDKPPKDPLS